MAPATSELGYEETVYDLNVQGDMIGAAGGHGGGDQRVVEDFVSVLEGNPPSISCTLTPFAASIPVNCAPYSSEVFFKSFIVAFVDFFYICLCRFRT